MRHVRIAAAAAASAGLLLAGCSSGTSKPAATNLGASSSSVVAATSVATSATTSAAPSTSRPPTTTPSTSSTCSLPDKGDIIAWSKAPGVPDSANELGGTDPEHCHWTFDTLKTSSPTGSGYCTEAAWASDNPGYDPNATPAPRLKKVQVVIGDCG